MPGWHSGHSPKVTVVHSLNMKQVKQYRMLIPAYLDVLPPPLQALLKDVFAQLPKE